MTEEDLSFLSPENKTEKKTEGDIGFRKSKEDGHDRVWLDESLPFLRLRAVHLHYLK